MAHWPSSAGPAAHFALAVQCAMPSGSPLTQTLDLMFTQSENIRDHVFPLAAIAPGTTDFSRMLGSAFLLGNRGFALTAAHVFNRAGTDLVAGLFVDSDGTWTGFNAFKREIHPTEDVAVVQLTMGPWRSIFRLSGTNENASSKYQLFGYPDDTTFELHNAGKVVARPDLVYNEGYVRRRYSGALPGVKGCSFLELSEIAGSGASGSPLFRVERGAPQVIGIYSLERLNDRSTSVSYAVREEVFREWAPSIVGRTLAAESAQ
jgi:hypothetical protein